MSMNRKHIGDAGKSDLFSQMHTLLDAGLDMSGVFGILLDESTGEASREMLELMYDEVLAGASLSDAMNRCRRFEAMDCGVIGVGEMAGRLPQTMEFLASYYAARDAHSRMIRSALAYPLMILAFAVAVLVFMLTVIVPVFGDIYTRMDSQLPDITRRMLALSEHAPLVLGLCAGLVAVVVLLWMRFRDTDRFDIMRSRVLMGLPFVGKIVRTDSQCTFCRLMSLLTASGVTMMDSLELAGHSMRIRSYREAFPSIMESVRNGSTLAGAMTEHASLFEKRLLSMVRVGEESNRLPDMFGRAADICSARLEERFKQIQTWLEPVMIVFVGLIVALVLVSMYLPMFRMGTTILGG